MRQLEELERFKDAYDLVHENLRVSIVCALTGVTPHFVKAMWMNAFGVASKKGQLPASVHVFVKDPTIAAQLSGYVAFCMGGHRNLRNVLSARTLLETVRQYRWVSGTNMDITAAYYAVRDAAAGVVEWKYCNSCDAYHLYSVRSFQLRGCPFCRLVAAKRAA